MALMTGEQYIQSIRKMNMKIYHFGKKVEKPVEDPILRPSLNSVRMTYDLAQMPEYQDLMTVISPDTGERINRFTHIHRSTDDLRNKVKMQRLCGQKTAACFQRCVGMDAFNAEYSTTYEIDKKYGTHSALNMFTEFSMTGPGPLAAFAGFTEKEVASLCRKYGMDFEECKNWYDGYHFAKAGAVYNPRSVILAMKFRKFDAYWNRTETFEALKIYIDMNYDGLREAIIALMAGERRAIDTGNFSNDMTTFHAMDDVLTLLVHLGYLGYDAASEEVYIPNK